MKKLFFFLLVLQCIISINAFSQGGGGVKNGKLAPYFIGNDQNGDTVSLNRYKGKEVAFYFNAMNISQVFLKIPIR
jgi:hypothetical protein